MMILDAQSMDVVLLRHMRATMVRSSAAGDRPTSMTADAAGSGSFGEAERAFAVIGIVPPVALTFSTHHEKQRHMRR
jgi:hypothetical protein